MGRLLQGSDGNFYGVTKQGGGNGTNGGAGTVFRITLTGMLTTLYRFTGGNDGALPAAGLAQGNDGNFYGTTSGGGATGEGTVFNVTPTGTLTTVYSFSAVDSNNVNGDGAIPNAGLVQGSDGNFYGATSTGGANGEGAIYRITSAGVLTTLYSFTGSSDGSAPSATLVQGSDGNFYGTTSAGGANGAGTIFEVTRTGRSVNTLHSFDAGSEIPSNFAASLVQGSDGNFYGTTEGLGPVAPAR